MPLAIIKHSVYVVYQNDLAESGLIPDNHME